MVKLRIGKISSGVSTPNTPTGFTATASSASSIALSWDASTGATSYLVERSLNGSTGWTSVYSSTGTSTTNSGLTGSTTYYYRLKALNNNGSSGYATANATTSAFVPGTLSAAPVVATSGWSTFGQVIPQGQVPSGSGVVVSGYTTQSNILNAWSDGSARFVAVTCKPTSTGTLSLSSGTSASGSFTPTIPTSSVAFVIGGTTYTATLPNTVSSDVRFTGPLMMEWRHLVTPKTSGNVDHSHLRVIFDVRVYNDGTARVDIAVENCLNKTGYSNYVYNVTFTVNGSTVFTKTSHDHKFTTRWRKYGVVSGTEGIIHPDFEPAHVAGAIHRILSTVDSTTYPLVSATHVIGGRGNVPTDFMPDTGGRIDVGFVPDWTGEYIALRGAHQREVTLVNGDLAGSWPCHVKTATNGFLSIDDFPDWWYYTMSPSSNIGFVDGRPYDDTAKFALFGTLFPDNSHQPTLCYMPYLITADRYYADEMAYWGNFSMLSTYPVDVPFGSADQDGRGRSAGYVGTDQIRARAWGLRSITHPAAYLPDNDARKAYFVTKVGNNLSHLQTFAAARIADTANPFKIIFYFVNTAAHPEPNVVTNNWMSTYLAWAIDHANRQGLTGATNIREAVAALQLRFATSEPDYPKAYAGPYWPIVGVNNSGTYTLFTTMLQVYNATIASGREPLLALNSYYGPELRAALIFAIEAGLPNSQATFDWLMSQSGMTAYIKDRAAFAIMPRQPGDA